MPPVKKKERRSLTFELKMKVLRRMENGGKATIVGRDFGLSESTVRTIYKNREKIKISSESSTPISATKLSRSRPSILEKMEKLLSVWIEDSNKKNTPLSQDLICTKAKSLYEMLKTKEGEGSATPTFAASRGWFHRFKKRSNLHKMHLTGEEVSADIQAAAEFPDKFQEFVKREKIPASLIFNVAAGLYWKKMPTHDDFLDNKDLIKLENNPIYVKEEQVEEKVLSSGAIQNALSKIYSGLEILQSIDNNDDRVLTVCETIKNSVECYERILQEREQKDNKCIFP